MNFFKRCGEFLLWKVLLRPMMNKTESRLREREAQLDAAEPLSDLVMPFADEAQASQQRVGGASLVVRYEDFQIPQLMSIAPQIGSGKIFGIEYPATLTGEKREQILAQLRAMLPYAQVKDEGKHQAPAPKYESESAGLLWGVSIALSPPGYGIADEEIDANADQFVAAAREFRVIADELVQTILRVHDVPLEDLRHLGCVSVGPGGEERAREIVGETLDGVWNIAFSTGAWHLTSRENGQEIRVSLFHGATGGVLNAHGFARFLRTTPRWSSLADLLRDDYFDARRVLWRLYKGNRWEFVPRQKDLRLLGTNAIAAPLAK